jgi:hypothetical protein
VTGRHLHDVHQAVAVQIAQVQIVEIHRARHPRVKDAAVNRERPVTAPSVRTIGYALADSESTLRLPKGQSRASRYPIGP